MKVILEWNGDQNQLADDDRFSLVDSIIWHLDYATDNEISLHNKIEITVDRSEQNELN